MTTFQRADPSFTASAPEECSSRRSGSLLARLPRQDHVSYTAVARRLLVAARAKPTIGDGQIGSVLEKRDVAVQGRFPEGAIRLTTPNTLRSR